MATTLNALLNIRANVEGGSKLQQLGAQLAGIGTSAGKTGPPIQAMRTGLQSLAAVAGTVGLGLLGKQLLDAGVAAQASEVRIAALTKQYGESEQLAGLAAEAAQKFALGNVEARNAVADLYGRLRPMGVGLKQIETVFFGVNTAARQMGLSAADTEGVMLQLSQALGSGKLQGDELRSIMEALPAVGQAVAKTMGVPVAAIKELGSQGKITTEIMLQAAEELTKMELIDPTPVQKFDKAMKDLNTEIGENLLPILVPFIEGLSSLMRTIGALPEPIQTAIVALGALAFIAGPVASAISAIGSAMVVLGPILTGIGATIAGWAGVIGPALAAVVSLFQGAGAAILAIFSGPVGWTVLAVAAVVAMCIAFREPLGKFLTWVGGLWQQFLQYIWDLGEPVRQFWINLWGVAMATATEAMNTWKGIFQWGLEAIWSLTYTVFLQPWVNLWNNLLRAPVQATWNWLTKAFDTIGSAWETYVSGPIGKAWDDLMQMLPRAMKRAADFVVGIWQEIVDKIRSIVNGVMNIIGGSINTVIDKINGVIRGYNQLPGTPDIREIPPAAIPQFAEGGFVTGPTVAMIGDNPGGREYVIPEGKAAGFASNYINGARGAAAIPRAGGGAPMPAIAPINITTGPVMEMDGSRYVKVEDLERAVRQTQQQIYATLRTPGGRRAIGVA